MSEARSSSPCKSTSDAEHLGVRLASPADTGSAAHREAFGRVDPSNGPGRVLLGDQYAKASGEQESITSRLMQSLAFRLCRRVTEDAADQPTYRFPDEVGMAKVDVV